MLLLLHKIKEVHKKWLVVLRVHK